jgi:hypothetical protein
MAGVDLKRELNTLYTASARQVAEVVVPALEFLMVDGQGDPDTCAVYREAVEALYAVAYTLKFSLKRERGRDYAVMPLEGLWWSDDPGSFARGEKDQWRWTMMILQPPEVDAALVQAAIATVRARKALPGLARLRLERFEEGRCAQLLHVGPFSDEGPAIQRLHGYIAARSALRGRHHEIYLSDIRRAAPEKWKTIIRQPMD